MPEPFNLRRKRRLVQSEPGEPPDKKRIKQRTLGETEEDGNKHRAHFVPKSRKKKIPPPDYIKDIENPLYTEDELNDLKESYTRAAKKLCGNEHTLVFDYYERSINGIFDDRPVIAMCDHQQYNNVLDPNAITTRYNIPLPPMNPYDEKNMATIKKYIVDEYIGRIVPKLTNVVKMNVMIGGMLEFFNDDGEIDNAVYYFPTPKTSLLPQNKFGKRIIVVDPSYDNERSQLESNLRDIDVLGAMHRDRPDTHTKCLFLTNVYFRFYKLVDVKVGSDPPLSELEHTLKENIVAPIPNELKKSNLRCLRKYLGTKNQCMWMAIQRQLRIIHPDDVLTVNDIISMFVQYRHDKFGLRKPTLDDYKDQGVNIFAKQSADQSYERYEPMLVDGYCDLTKTISQMEDCFGFNINVYFMDPESINHFRKNHVFETNNKNPRCNQHVILSVAHLSCGKHKPDTEENESKKYTLNLLLDGMDEHGRSHVHEIVKIETFLSRFRCRYCERYFKRKDHYVRHLRSGTCLCPFDYPGGTYTPYATVFDELEHLGIDWRDALNMKKGENVNCDHCVTWDIEAKINEVSYQESIVGEKTQILGIHQAVSISMKANFGDKRDTLFWYDNKDPEHLFTQAYKEMCRLQEVNETMWHERMQNLYQVIERRIIECGGNIVTTRERYENMDPSLAQKLLFNFSTQKNMQRIERKYAHVCIPHPFMKEHDAEFYASRLETENELSISDKSYEYEKMKWKGQMELFEDRETIDKFAHAMLNGDLTGQFLKQYEEGYEVVDEDYNIEMRKDLSLDEFEFMDQDFESDVEEEDVIEDRSKPYKKTHRYKYVMDLKSALNRLKRYGSLLKIIGFNSGQYDINVLRQIWPKVVKIEQSISHKEEQYIHPIYGDICDGPMIYVSDRDVAVFRPLVICNGNNYKRILTIDGVEFLDLINYVPAKTSLDKLVKSYHLKQEKGFFPYAILNRDDLSEIKLDPTKECYDLFKDSMKKSYHRKQHNSLEGDWQKYTLTHHTHTIQEVIRHVARDIAFGLIFSEIPNAKRWFEMYQSERQKPYNLIKCILIRDMIGKHKRNQNDYEQLTRELMDVGGFHNVSIQKQNRWELEDVVTLLPHKSEQHSFIYEKPTSFTWLRIINDPDKSYKKLPVTGLGNFWHILNIWKKEKCENMIDFLRWYNNGDVEIMQPLINAMRENYRSIDKSLNLFHDNVSLPNIARNIGFKEAESNGGIFHLAKGPIEGATYERKIRRNLIGGPSIIFDRLHEAYVSKINGHFVETISTYDANGLYSRRMQGWLPVGSSVHQYLPNSKGKWIYTELGRNDSSIGEKAWIKFMDSVLNIQATKERKQYAEGQYPKDINIITRNSTGKVIRIGSYVVDGVRFRCQWTDAELKLFDPKFKGIVYEYLGDWFHGHPLLQSKNKDNARSFNYLMEKAYDTVDKIRNLYCMGYIVHIMWDSDFTYRFKKEWQEYAKHEIPPFTFDYLTSSTHSREKLLKQLSDPDKFYHLLMEDFDKDAIQRDDDGQDHPLVKPFGMAEVDLEFDEEKQSKEYIELVHSFPPLFVKGMLPGEKHPQLRSVLKAEKVLLFTSYIQLVLSLGYVIKKVYGVWEFNAKKCLKPFIDNIVKERQKADLPGGNEIQGQTYKLVGNSFYGGSVMNKDKHTSVQYYKDKYKVCNLVNQPTFVDVNYMGDNVYEIHSSSKKVQQNIPIQLGKCVLDTAKEHMIKFFYYVLAEHCCINKFALMSMDTDSFTLAIAGKNLDDIVAPDKKKEWDEVIKKHWFVHANCTPTVCSINPDKCNKKIPGPFKLEYSGDKAVCLSSKLFTVTSKTPGVEPKLSSKGLKKNQVEYDASDKFERALLDDDTISVQLNSFIVKQENMTTTNATRTVSNKYSKRDVQENDVTKTDPLKDSFYCGTPTEENEIRTLRFKLMNERKTTQIN